MSNTSLSLSVLLNSTTKVELVRVFASEYTKPSVSVTEYEDTHKFFPAAARLLSLSEGKNWVVSIQITRKHEGGWMSREEISSVLFTKLVVWEFFTKVIPSLTKVFHRHDDGIEGFRRDWEGNLKNVISLEEQQKAILIAADEAKYEWQMSGVVDEAKAVEEAAVEESSTVAEAFDPIEDDTNQK